MAQEYALDACYILDAYGVDRQLTTGKAPDFQETEVWLRLLVRSIKHGKLAAAAIR